MNDSERTLKIQKQNHETRLPVQRIFISKYKTKNSNINNHVFEIANDTIDNKPYLIFCHKIFITIFFYFDLFIFIL